MLLEQFRSFYYRNYPEDMESAIELFSIFGGLDIVIDTSKHKEALIKEHILENFFFFESFIQELLLYRRDAMYLLRALSIGDRKIFSSFKKARLNNQKGGVALHFLQEKGLVRIELSREEDKRKYKSKLSKEEARYRISDKFFIVYPFLRFWFYFVYPHAKEIAQKSYKAFFDDYRKKQYGYSSLVFEELSQILLNYHLQDEIIETIGSYWDANSEIDIMATTQAKHTYIAECKWTNHKINKKEFNKLLEKCDLMNIRPTQLILFSKRGFSKELEAIRSSFVVLYSVEDFVLLVKTKPSKMLFPLSLQKTD